jgi:hypothetical protein
MTDEARAEIREYVAREIAAGFRDRDGIVEGAIEMFGDEYDPAELADAVPAEYDVAFAAHRDAQRAWPPVTDCDRLDAAFDALNARGIVARHDWWCCQTCGHAAMPDACDNAATANPAVAVRGYAFYHNQDTESAAEGHGLMLAFGTHRAEDAPEEVARTVVATLREHGLEVEWNGRVETRIAVRLVYQRRERPSRWCEE